MASHAKNDFVSLAEELFDFDVSLSPASDKGGADEEDEVFVGPVGHKEKCISVGIEKNLSEGSSGSSGRLLSLELGSWSPLTAERFDRITQEAHLVARQIGKVDGEESAAAGAHVGPVGAPPGETAEEHFAEDSEDKLSALRPPPGPSLSPIKRETFCVQDSPLKQLPPAIQQRLLQAGGLNSPSAVQATGRKGCPLQAPQPKMALRGRVALSGGRGLLPSRPAVPGVTRRSSAKLPPPDKGVAGPKPSPLVRGAGSSEDLLSDTSVDSLNTSLPERRTLLGPRKMGQPPSVKPAPGLRTADRRKNTSSSSSSSMSSLNSSLSVSPSGKGALATPLSSAVSGARFKGPGGLSRLPGSAAAASSKLGAARRAAEVARGGRPAPSTQVKRAAEPLSGPPTKRDSAPLSLTPAKRPVRAGSVPNVAVVTATAKGGDPKPKVFVSPTVMSRVKGRRSEAPSPDASRIMKPKRFLSVSSVDSVLPKAGLPAPQGLQTPTVRGGGVSALPRRSLALPTPDGRRRSGIPTMTPKSVRLSQAGERSRNSSQGSPVQLKVAQRPSGQNPEPEPEPEPFPGSDGSCGDVLQPRSLAFSLDDEPGDAPIAPRGPYTPKRPSQRATEGPADRPSQDAAESSRGSQKTPETTAENQKTLECSKENERPRNDSAKTPEHKVVLLVDAPAPVLKPEDRPLIDLSNTPDLIKTAAIKPTPGGQLIDLSSPLITWSPAEKKGTMDRPLIDLSF